MQVGGNRMGGTNLIANGFSNQSFVNIAVMPVDRIWLAISLSLKSTGSAFAAVVSTGPNAAAEGVDDMDLLLNAVLAAIILDADTDTALINNLSMAQLRTHLGILNLKDFDGNLVNGASIPSSGSTATAFTIMISLPFSLKNMFADGDMFHQGSTRLSIGDLQLKGGATLTPNVVLANGTATVSGLSYQLYPEAGMGTENDVGPLVQVKRTANYKNIDDLDDAMRLYVADQLSAVANPATSIIFGEYTNWTPTNFAARYQGDQLTQGGYDVTARVTPYTWFEKRTIFADLLARVTKRYHFDLTGVSAVALYDCKILGNTASVLGKVSTIVGAGGPLTIANVSPPSLPPGARIPDVVAHLLPQRLVAGKVGTPGSAVSHANSPQQAVNTVVAKGNKASLATAIMKKFGAR